LPGPPPGGQARPGGGAVRRLLRRGGSGLRRTDAGAVRQRSGTDGFLQGQAGQFQAAPGCDIRHRVAHVRQQDPEVQAAPAARGAGLMAGPAGEGGVAEPRQGGLPLDGFHAWQGLLLLTLAYVLAFVDRQILNLLVDPVKRDLLLSDTQVSLLQGIAFTATY